MKMAIKTVIFSFLTVVKNVAIDDENADDNEKVYMSGRVNPKYQPQNFFKMTSVEVVDILKKSILFDARMFFHDSILR